MAKETDATEVSLGAETAKATVAKFSMAAIGFVGTIIFARILGPEKFGAYYLLFALVKIADLPIDGWANAAKKRFSEDETPKRELVGGQFLVVGGWAGVGLLAAFLAAGPLESYTGIEGAALPFVVLLVGEAVYVSAERLLQSRGLIGIATWTDALRSYATFALQLLLVLSGWGAVGMAYGLAAASVLVTPVTLYYLGVTPALPSVATMRNQWEYARYSIPSSLLGRAYERFDILLLGYLLTPTAAGLYEVALKLVTPARFVAEAASSGLMARVSTLSSRGERFGQDVTNVLSFTSVLAIPIFFGAIPLASDLVVTIYGSDYAAAAPLLVGIALYHVVMTQSMTLSQTVYGLDLPHRVMWTSAIAVTINVVLGVVLTLRFGAIGVVVSTLVAEIVMYVLYSRLVQRYEEVTFLSRPLLVQLAAGGVMFVVVAALTTSRLLGASRVALAVTLAVGATVYFAVTLLGSRQIREAVTGAVRDAVG